MYGYGYLAGKYSNGDGDPLLSNPLANHFYYDALVVANGGVEDFHTYYGVSLATFKTTINTAYDALDTAGLTSKIKRWTPRIGSIAATQCINAINPGTYDGTFTGGVTFSTAGTVYDGVTGYEDTGFSQLDFIGVNDAGQSFNLVAQSYSGTSYIMGSKNDVPGTFMTNWIDSFAGSDYMYTAFGGSTNIDAILLSLGFFTYSRLSGDFKIQTYLNGALASNVSHNSSLGLQDYNQFIGCYNDVGVPSNFASVTLRNECFHDKLTSQESLNLYNIMNALDTSLGR
jgi:hypothetical protein